MNNNINQNMITSVGIPYYIVIGTSNKLITFVKTLKHKVITKINTLYQQNMKFLY